jgi:hypothetical protein
MDMPTQWWWWAASFVTAVFRDPIQALEIFQSFLKTLVVIHAGDMTMQHVSAKSNTEIRTAPSLCVESRFGTEGLTTRKLTVLSTLFSTNIRCMHHTP